MFFSPAYKTTVYNTKLQNFTYTIYVIYKLHIQNMCKSAVYVTGKVSGQQ